MNIFVKYKKKRLLIKNIKKAGIFLKFRGLMFRNIEKSPILMFENCNSKAIHSYFVFFPFLVLWLNDKNSVVEWKIVKPFSVYEKSNKDFSKIIEIPINKCHKKLLASLDIIAPKSTLSDFFAK